MMTPMQCLTRIIVAATAIAAAVGAVFERAQAEPAAASPDPQHRPWLDVTLPAQPAAGTPTAKIKLKLQDHKRHASEFAGVRLWVGGAGPRLVPAGSLTELTIAASERAPLRMKVQGFRVLAHVRPGDTLTVDDAHDGGWFVAIGNRTAENAPRQLTVCPKVRLGDCPNGYTWTPVFPQDTVCPPPTDDAWYKCVKAPMVRGRGPLTSAELIDETGRASLVPQPLSGNAFGPWTPAQLGPESMARVRLGSAEAFLVLAPGDACQVWLDEHGQVDSALSAVSRR
jgi:hypothetical protein